MPWHDGIHSHIVGNLYVQIVETRRATGWLVAVSSCSSGQLWPTTINKKKTPLSPKQSSGHLPPLPLWEFLHLFCPWGPRAAILKQARLGNYSPRSKQGRHGRAIDQNSG